MVAGALACATFWLIAARLETFVGAEVVRHSLWVPGQLLHTLGALLVVVALPALDRAVTVIQPSQPGPLMLATIGTALFAADGLIALSVFPAIASEAPLLLEATGAMNHGIMLITHIAVSTTNMLGWLALGVAWWHRGLASRALVLCVIVGSIVGNLPPGPVPVELLAAGGLLWSGALALLALRAR